MSAELRVHLTGKLSASYGGRVVGVESFRGRQGRIAFAYLATHHDRAVPRPELGEILWADALPKSWESDLSAIVSRLRGVLVKLGLEGSRTIATALGCHELRIPDGTVWTDLEAAARSVEEAESALRSGDAGGCVSAATVAREIARRPLLPGDECEWLDRTRDELRQLLLRALAALGEGWSLKDEIAPAVEAAQHEVEIDPFAEPAYRRLMRFHAAAGNRPEALRAWERCRTLLAEELGIDPSPETKAVYLEVLGAEVGRGAARPAAIDRGTVTLLFTDLVGSSELLALGDEGAESIRRAHFALLRDAVTTRGGEEVKSLGDGLMVAFASVRDALGCAVAMQQAVERHNRRSPHPLAVRIGMHAGEPIRDEEDYFGTAVVVARRLCDEAAGGQILASDVVRGLAGPQGFVFADAGGRVLKGLPGTHAVYDVAWQPALGERVALPSPLRPPADPPFVGREREVGRLMEQLDRVQEGRLLVSLVPGDPGIGKSRLVGEFASVAHELGNAVLYGRCDEEALTAYQPFVEAIDRYASDASLDDLRRHAGRGAPDLARVVPALAQRFPELPRPMAGDAEAERFRLFDAMSAFVSSVADEASLVLVFEDVHWADRPTLLLLRHLARQKPEHPLLVVATVRDVEVTKQHPLVEVIDELTRDDALVTSPLAGLDETSVRAMVEAILGKSDPALATAIVKTTEGNPLFVRELSRHIADTGDASLASVPEGIRGLIGRRLDRLGEETLRILARAAVVGRDFDLDVLVELSESTEESILELLDASVDAHVLDEVTGAIDRYTFTHALIRETLYSDLSTARRRRQHLRTAAAIERMRASDISAYVGELAYHYGAAGGGYTREAFEYASRAGDQAMSKLAYEDAAGYYEHALVALRTIRGGSGGPPIDETDVQAEIDHLISFGRALSRSGEHARASAAYIDATELARSVVRRSDGNISVLIRNLKVIEAFADAVLGLSEAWVQTGLVDARRTRLLEEALALLPEGELRRRALVTGKLAHEIYHDPGSLERRLALAEEALELARRSRDAMTIARCLHHRTFASWGPDTTRGDLESAGDEMVQLGRATGDLDIVLQGINWHMMAALVDNDVETFDAHLRDYEQVAEELRQPRYVWYAKTRHARQALYRGRLDDGARLTTEAYEMAVRLGEGDAINVYMGQMMFVWQERLDDDGIERVRALVRSLEEAEDASRPSSTLLWWRAAASSMDARLGVTDGTRTVLDDLIAAGLATIPRDYHWLPVMKRFGDTAYWSGHTEGAVAIYESLRPYGGLSVAAGGADPDTFVDHGLGRLALLIGRLDEAIAYLGSAIELCDRTGAEAFAAITQRDLAWALQRRGAAGDDVRADEALDAARSAAHRLGLILLSKELEVSADERFSVRR